jgi:FkbM family methyltransferase
VKSRIKLICYFLAISLVIGETILFLIPSARTAVYVAVYRASHPVSPYATGRQLPTDPCQSYGRLVPAWTNVEPGVRMRLDPCDLVTRTILLVHTWEPATTHEILGYIPAGGTFVDVGAHVGWYTLKAAKVVGPKGHVIAVEPNRETLVTLRENIAASGAGSIVVVAPVACSDSESTLTLYATARENTGESSLSKANASQDTTIAASYPVRARRLDDIVNEAGVGRVNALKIDVEGAEFLVLKGAAATLDRDKPVVAVELVDEQLKSMGSSVAEVTAFMRSHGYTPAAKHELNMVFLPAAGQ